MEVGVNSADSKATEAAKPTKRFTPLSRYSRTRDKSQFWGLPLAAQSGKHLHLQSGLYLIVAGPALLAKTSNRHASHEKEATVRPAITVRSPEWSA